MGLFTKNTAETSQNEPGPDFNPPQMNLDYPPKRYDDHIMLLTFKTMDDNIFRVSAPNLSLQSNLRRLTVRLGETSFFLLEDPTWVRDFFTNCDLPDGLTMGPADVMIPHDEVKRVWQTKLPVVKGWADEH